MTCPDEPLSPVPAHRAYAGREAPKPSSCSARGRLSSQRPPPALPGGALVPRRAELRRSRSSSRRLSAGQPAQTETRPAPRNAPEGNKRRGAPRTLRPENRAKRTRTWGQHAPRLCPAEGAGTPARPGHRHRDRGPAAPPPAPSDRPFRLPITSETRQGPRSHPPIRGPGGHGGRGSARRERGLPERGRVGSGCSAPLRSGRARRPR